LWTASIIPRIIAVFVLYQFYRPPIIKISIYTKKPTLFGFCTKPTKSALKSVKKSIFGLGLFSKLFRTFIPDRLCISSQNAFWRVRVVFLRFGIYGNTLKIIALCNAKTPEKSGVFGLGSIL